MVCYLGGWSGNLKVVRGYSEDGELSRGVWVCVCVCVEWLSEAGEGQSRGWRAI